MPRRKAKPPSARRNLIAIPAGTLTLRPKRVAEVLDVSERTVWSMIRAGRLRVARPSPGLTLVLVHSIDELLAVT
jgi:excisionase family DNA binding protein